MNSQLCRTLNHMSLEQLAEYLNVDYKEIEEICNIELDSSYTARKLFNIIRGKMFHPYSPAFFYDGSKKYSVEINIKEKPTD